MQFMQSFIPIMFHNLNSDLKMFIEELSKTEGEIDNIAKNDKMTSITKK